MTDDNKFDVWEYIPNCNHIKMDDRFITRTNLVMELDIPNLDIPIAIGTEPKIFPTKSLRTQSA